MARPRLVAARPYKSAAFRIAFLYNRLPREILPMLPVDLIDKINTGRCFALIGAGPSAELGYPSWYDLADGVYREVMKRSLASDQQSYESYLAKRKLAELLDLAEHDLGSRDALVSIVRRLLRPINGRSSQVYEFLVRWPFACYLTTNYDDELEQRLKAAGQHFVTLRNRKEDFYALRDSASNLVVKLHSDLDHPNELVLTSSDYQKYETSAFGQYFRDRLRAVFEMFDVLVVGHSLNDPDIGWILKMAKETASPSHPVYVVIADITIAEQRELRTKYNVVAIPYENPDGTHIRLRQILRVADKFIAPRRGFATAFAPQQSEDETAAATSLLIYRRLQAGQSGERDSPARSYAPAVLSAMARVGSPIDQVELQKAPPLDTLISSDAAREVLREAIEYLQRERLIVRSGRPERLSLTDVGQERVAEVRALRELEERTAFSELIAQVKALYPALSDEQGKLCETNAKVALVSVFRARGLSIASSIYADRSVAPTEYGDVFKALSQCASIFDDGDLRAAFLEATRDFLIEPTQAQTRYLESLSQGFFLYHLAGLDPKATRVRREVLRGTTWFLDSSVILPWMAMGSHSYEYANDLFTRLKAAGANLVTTERLLRETWDHLDWAVRRMRDESPGGLGLLDVALMHDSYKQNLFIDGYIRLAAEGHVGTFADYLARLSPRGITRERMDEVLIRRGIVVVDMASLPGFEEDDWGDLPDIERTIREARQRKGTYRHAGQVEAEAEVLHLIRSLRAGKYRLSREGPPPERIYFASQSRVLDRIANSDPIVTWTPEALYRYVTALPGEQSDPELLQKCMLNEYYFSGVSFIDKARYREYFGPTIRESRAIFAEQRAQYIAEVESDANIDDAFERTPDLEKPFFVSQLTTRVAAAAVARANAQAARAEAAEARLRILEAEKARGWKRKAGRQERQEAARARQAADPAHQRKKQRQAKKRRKKKP